VNCTLSICGTTPSLDTSGMVTISAPARRPAGRRVALAGPISDAQMIGVGEVRHRDGELAAQPHHAVAVLEVEREERIPGEPTSPKPDDSTSGAPRTSPRTTWRAWRYQPAHRQREHGDRERIDELRRHGILM